MSGAGAVTVLAAALQMAACGGGSVAMPAQRRTYSGPEPREFGAFARLADPRCAGHLVRGLRPSGRWAWTERVAELRFRVDDAHPQKFTADVYLGASAFRETGPVTIACRISGRLLGTLRCDAAREFVFEQKVPDGWIEVGRTTTVTLEADKVWVAPDGMEYGFLLVSAGFLPQ